MVQTSRFATNRPWAAQIEIMYAKIVVLNIYMHCLQFPDMYRKDCQTLHMMYVHINYMDNWYVLMAKTVAIQIAACSVIHLGHSSTKAEDVKFHN